MEEPVMKPQTEHFSKKAVNYFDQGYNCAQSVLLTMQEYYGIPENKSIPKIATAFGGGIGRLGSLCGALTGAIIAIGLKYGTNEPILEKKEKAYKLTQKFYEQFVNTSGSQFCKELIGFDLTDPEELERARKSKVREEKCLNFVEKAVEILIDLEV